MGSGHFLVTAVDFLSDYIAELVEYVPAVPEWLGGGKGGKEGRGLRLAAGGAGGGDPGRDRPAGAGGGLGPGRSPAQRPGDHPPHGPQALHLRRGQEPPHRRAGQGLAVAAQLHRGRAALLPRPPPALRRLPDRAARAGGAGGAAAAGRAVRQLRHRGRRERRLGDAADRGAVRRRRGRGAGIRRPLPGRRRDHGRSAGAARHPLRAALAERRDEEAGSRRLRGAAGGGAGPAAGQGLHPAGPRPGSRRSRGRFPSLRGALG